MLDKALHNAVLAVSAEDIKTVKDTLSASDSTYIVEIDGAHIQSWEDFISEMQSKFKFPTPCFDSVDRYLDWMRDLAWLSKDSYSLIITNYGLFMKNAPELKQQIISDFAEVILPFWEEEVVNTIVGGKAKIFILYLAE